MSIEFTILVVDDDKYILPLIQEILEMEGYKIILASSGQEAIDRFIHYNPDLILLDLMLPDMDGYTVCRHIRNLSAVPIIVVTARGEDDEKLRGFDAGADDYVTKPFSARELVARVNAVLRRVYKKGIPIEKTTSETSVFVNRDLRIDFEKKLVTLKNKPVELSSTEFKILAYLAQNSEKVIPPEEILENVWGKEYRNEIHLLQVNVARLRQKLNDDARESRFIETRPGQGYVMIRFD